MDQLEAKTPKIEFKIKNVNRSKSKIYFTDISAHTEMMTLLREKNTNSYSFTPKEMRQTSLILRGLYSGCETEEIYEAFNNLIPNVVAKAVKYKTSYSSKNNIDTGLYLISLLPGKGLGDVSHIRTS